MVYNALITVCGDFRQHLHPEGSARARPFPKSAGKVQPDTMLFHVEHQLGIGMMSRERIWLLLLFAIALVALILLSSGLEDLEFAPGHLSLLRETEGGATVDGSGQALTRSELIELLFRVIGVLALLLLPFSIAYVIISPEARKRVFRGLLLLLWIVAAVILLRNQPELLEQLRPETRFGAPIDGSFMPTVEFNPAPPAWLITAATVVFAILLAGGIVAIAWYLWRQSQRPAPPLEMLRKEAQRSLDALSQGADPQDTVMRCYVQMSRNLAEGRGLRREEAMTPREFERQLEAAGLPEKPIRALTRLFESVRYGAKPASERQERQAIDALTAIVDACGSGA